MSFLLDANLNAFLDLIGTFAFAISGMRLATGKGVDWLGAYVIGLVTAIGGGTTRDVLLGITPFWMEDARYMLVTGVAFLAIVVFRQGLLRLGRTLFLFDAIGLGFFTVSGIGKSLDAGFPIWVCIMMGTISGCVGGVIRDIIINEVPLLFRKDLYAVPSILGGIVFFILVQIPVDFPLHALMAALTVIFVRIIAVRFHLQLPRFDSLESVRGSLRKKR